MTTRAQTPRMACLDGLLRLALDVRIQLERIAAEFELSPPMARTLLLLEEPMRMREIAEAAGCEPSHVTGLAAQLEAAGLAAREVDPDDRRARRLVLTAAGEDIRRRLLPRVLAGAPLLPALDDEQVAQLLALLEVGSQADPDVA